MRRKTIIIITGLLNKLNLISQTLFERSYTNINNAREIRVTSDGGSIVASKSSIWETVICV